MFIRSFGALVLASLEWAIQWFGFLLSSFWLRLGLFWLGAAQRATLQMQGFGVGLRAHVRQGQGRIWAGMACWCGAPEGFYAHTPEVYARAIFP